MWRTYLIFMLVVLPVEGDRNEEHGQTRGALPWRLENKVLMLNMFYFDYME